MGEGLAELPGECAGSKGLKQRAPVKLEPLETVFLLLSSSAPEEPPPRNEPCWVPLFHTWQSNSRDPVTRAKAESSSLGSLTARKVLGLLSPL